MKINKGQFFLSNFDNFLFHFKKSKGHRLHYLWERYKWNNYPKKHILSSMPLLVDIETSSVCNLKCPMCFTVSEEYKKNAVKKFMDLDLFKKIIDECAENNVYTVRLSYRGEPFINPQILDMIKYAKNAGIKEVSSLTNATAITPEMFEEILKAGLDWLTISFDGLYEKYEEIRRPAKFEEMYDRIKQFAAIKKKYKSTKPILKVQAIWTQIQNDPDAYYEAFIPYVDNIATNALISFDDNREEKSVFEENFDCPFVWQRLTVLSNGDVSICINDEQVRHIISNVKDNSIKSIWNGETFQKIRETHKNHLGLKDIEVCRRCYLPRKSIPKVVTLKNNKKLVMAEYCQKETTE